MTWIQPTRVTHALHNLNEWRKAVQDQGAKHLLPLLALLEKGAGLGQQIRFDETPHEFDFWDRYFRLEAGEEAKPYFNPVTLRRAERSYPHSNAATIRKNTFALKWHAATRKTTAQGDYWTLSPQYAKIFEQCVLTKRKIVTRVPVLDIAIVLFRNEALDNVSDSRGLESEFRRRFPQTDADYRTMFEMREEPGDQIFIEFDPGETTQAAVESALIESIITPDAFFPNILPLEDENPVLIQVHELLMLGTSGLILSGPPGTGKTYYAQRIAETLVTDHAAGIWRVQFHPSYGYEDFVEGYRPDSNSTSGFSIVDKTFIRAAEIARSSPGKHIVLIIDEINRGDPSRVFGELLTYLEKDYRNIPFTLPFSGRPFCVPSNLLLIGTLNPYDRSVSHIDAAFTRRFDHIQILPSREVLESRLENHGRLASDQVVMIGDWFENAQSMFEFGLGHALFNDARDIDTLKLVWRHRITPMVNTLLELEPSKREGLTASFEALLRRLDAINNED